MSPRRTVFVIFDGFQTLDLAGPYEVFQHASGLSGGYHCEVVAPCAGPVRSGSGLPVHAAYGIADLDPATIDTLVDRGGGGVYQAQRQPALVAWIAAAGAGARRVTSVCSGVFLLAAAGLITGCRVTTHWGRAEQLAREHPEVRVDCDPIFIAQLAGHAGLSPRHLQRRFTAEIGTSPSAYVERVRVEAAQRALTEGDEPVDTIARRCGFGTAETLRRAFHRNARIAPSDYRSRFRSTREHP